MRSILAETLLGLTLVISGLTVFTYVHGQPQSILICAFHHEAAFFVKQDQVEVYPHRPGRGFELVFADLDSDSPKLKAQLGEGELQVLMRRPDAVWLAEPPLNGLNIYTIYRAAKVAMLSKQYHHSPLLGGDYAAVIAVGRCR